MSHFPRWSYALSLAHAALQSWKTVPYTLHFVFLDKLDPDMGPDPTVYRECMILFLVYIAVDSLANWDKLGKAYQTHHVLTAFAMSYNALCGPHALGMCVLSNEISTVFLSAKVLLPKKHVLRPYVYQCFGWSFFVFRVVINSLLVAHCFHVSTDNFVLMLSIWGLNVFWFIKGIFR